PISEFLSFPQELALLVVLGLVLGLLLVLLGVVLGLSGLGRVRSLLGGLCRVLDALGRLLGGLLLCGLRGHFWSPSMSMIRTPGAPSGIRYLVASARVIVTPAEIASLL